MAYWARIYIFIVLLFPLKILINSEKLRYQNAENCSRFAMDQTYIFQCPIEDPKIFIDVTLAEKVVVQCFTMDSWDLDLLPSMNVGDINYLDFSMCPWPTDGFEGIMNRFGITAIVTLKLEDLEQQKNITPSAYYFRKFKDLRKIIFSNNNLLTADVDLFKDMTKLDYIKFSGNKLKVQNDLFKYNLHLKEIDLTSNKLSTLPVGIFSNLHKLKELSLYSNNFTTLDANLFENLTNLQLLDLSINYIANLSTNTFYDLKNLRQLNFYRNQLEVLPNQIFSENKLLHELTFTSNEKLETLPEDLFLNLSKLKKVFLNECKLKKLPHTLFEGAVELEELDLSDNKLNKLPGNIFSPVRNLKTLRLTHNNISSLPEDIFSSQHKLEKLYLNKNHLTNITNGLFYRLKELKELNMKHNQISVIEYRAFEHTKELTDVNFAHNRLTLVDGDPFVNCVKMQTLDLSHNLITSYHKSWLFNKAQIVKLYLAYNKMTSIEATDLLKITSTKLEMDLRYNNITVVKLNQFVELARRNVDNLYAGYIQIFLKGNPIHCDCNIYQLAKYLDGTIDQAVKNMIQIAPMELTCSSPPEYKGNQIKEIGSKRIVCGMNASDCPKNCTCHIRLADKMRVIDCALRNLTQVPRLFLQANEVYDYNQTEVHLEGNLLTTGPLLGMGYENVTKLFLFNNRISEIKWVPPQIQVLRLDGNNLHNFNYDVLNALNNSRALSNLSLENNPWQCDCSIINLTYFLRDHKEIQGNNAKCDRNGTQLIKLDKTYLCDWDYKVVMISSIVIVTSLLIIVSIAALYFKYHKELKVLLYARGWCLWWVTEDEVDKDKIYDAFVSYSHKDEDFVEQILLPGLEQGPQAYKLCLHGRNWIAGEMIGKQITHSVEESRRTLIILSPHFLESTWGKLEFHVAHSQSLNEGRSRVIVILYGDVDPASMFDNELKAYLKTNTYIKWNDPWFWQKLRYAMPHQNNKLHSQKRCNNELNGTKDFMGTPQIIKRETISSPLNFALLKSAVLLANESEATAPMECSLSPLLTINSQNCDKN